VDHGAQARRRGQPPEVSEGVVEVHAKRDARKREDAGDGVEVLERADPRRRAGQAPGEALEVRDHQEPPEFPDVSVGRSDASCSHPATASFK